MKIGGIQKLTLLDYPGLVACTVFTVGCNFRCPFCHNASLVTGRPYEKISERDVYDYLHGRRGKLDGVCVTGGEPLMQPNIEQFVSNIKDMGFRVKLDTNGSFPDRLKSLIDKKLIDYVAMDVKNSPERYGETVGLADFDVEIIKKSADILRSGDIPYELRTTVTRELHTKKDIDSLGKWLSGSKKYVLQGFVDSGDIIGDNLTACSDGELQELFDTAKRHFVNASIRGR